MRQSEFDNPDYITKRIREIRHQENKPDSDHPRRYTMEIVPFDEAPIGKMGLIRLQIAPWQYVYRLGSRCRGCATRETCGCHVAGKPVYWCGLPEGWL
jgi:hypothetical protein